MISLREIEKFYPVNLHKFQNFILREYLQYKILEIIFDSEYSNKLCFLGGTCLRIVHNNTRFSEDLDFDNFGLSVTDFENIAGIILKKLTREGYEIEIKNVFSGAYHCYIRFPKLLFQEKISAHIDQKILIQIDTEPQNFIFKPTKEFLNKFDVFTSINTTPVDILLSQKFYALINRPRKKGRDFFDIIFLLKNTQPNYEYLNQKLGINSDKELKEMILHTCEKIDLNEMAKDVEPFLINSSENKMIKLFLEYINQIFK
jgi:predicted nucleotidyltransferase component of viral defense system